MLCGTYIAVTLAIELKCWKKGALQKGGKSADKFYPASGFISLSRIAILWLCLLENDKLLPYQECPVRATFNHRVEDKNQVG